MGVFHAAFGFFLTWWGAYLLAALDSTMVFFLPFGVDALTRKVREVLAPQASSWSRPHAPALR